ncbi:MAG: hypothetical protein AAB304_00300 [Pseudomonadota bacterium]
MPPISDILIGVLQKGLLMVLIVGAAAALAAGIWMLKNRQASCAPMRICPNGFRLARRPGR